MADPKASWENRSFRGQSRPGRTGSNGLETREHTDRTEAAQENIEGLEGSNQAGHIKRNNQGVQPGSTGNSSRVTKLGNRQDAVNDILAEKGASGDVQRNATGAPIFQPVPSQTAIATATMIPVFTPVNVVPGAGYNVAGELLVLGGTFTEQAVIVITKVKTVLGQDETDYSAAEDFGTFTGGSGYLVSDTITMADGTVVVVDAEAAGVVTEFHITTISVAPHVSNGDVIAQFFTSGEPGGTGFTMTLAVANQGAFDGLYKEVAEVKLGDYTALPTDPVATSGAPFGSNAATFNVNWGVRDVTVTEGGEGYTSPPNVEFADAGGGEEAGATAVLAGDSVTSVTVVTQGGGYVARALVTIDPPA